MRFLYFAEFIVGGIAMVLFITQVIIPLVCGRRTFPLFRRQGALESELAEVRQKREEDRLANVDLFTAKAARELGLDLSVLGKAATAPARKP